MQLFSKRICLLFQILLIITPFFTLFYWLNVEQYILLAVNPFSIPPGKLTFTLVSKIFGFVISLLPTMMVMTLFYQLVRLFKNYQLGKVFNKENVLYYQTIGKLLFILACVNFFCTPLMSIALSFQNPIGQRFISLSLRHPEIFPIVIGLVILGISFVMKEAHHLEEEQKYTV